MAACTAALDVTGPEHPFHRCKGDIWRKSWRNSFCDNTSRESHENKCLVVCMLLQETEQFQKNMCLALRMLLQVIKRTHVYVPEVYLSRPKGERRQSIFALGPSLCRPDVIDGAPLLIPLWSPRIKHHSIAPLQIPLLPANPPNIMKLCNEMLRCLSRTGNTWQQCFLWRLHVGVKCSVIQGMQCNHVAALWAQIC